jgi:hypothetical protein
VKLSDERAARNEAPFREANEKIADRICACRAAA